MDKMGGSGLSLMLGCVFSIYLVQVSLCRDQEKWTL